MVLSYFGQLQKCEESIMQCKKSLMEQMLETGKSSLSFENDVYSSKVAISVYAINQEELTGKSSERMDSWEFPKKFEGHECELIFLLSSHQKLTHPSLPSMSEVSSPLSKANSPTWALDYFFYFFQDLTPSIICLHFFK